MLLLCLLLRHPFRTAVVRSGALNLAYRCFCRLGLEGEVPDTRPSPGIEPTAERLELSPERIAADSVYGSADMLGWLVNERAIDPRIPVFDKPARADGTFSRQDFPYDQQRDTLHLPGRQGADLDRHSPE